MPLIPAIKRLRHEAYIAFYRRMPLQQNKLIIWADSFKHYGCSPKYIAEYLLANYPGRFDIVWVLEQGVQIPKELPREIRVVRYFSMEYLKELHTAKFVICNMRTGDAYYWHKRKEQIYIQTWHSTLRLKMIEGDAADHLPQSYVDYAKADSRKIDLLLSGCAFSTGIFRRAFWYDGEIMECGTPRCDILLQDRPEIRDRVFDCCQLPRDAKLLLYAPTFRDNKKADTMGMDFEALLRSLCQSGEKWVVGCRLHPNILESLPEIPNVVMMSKYPDMQELISACDMLITDYSSCMFDAAVAGKPCVLFVPDMENYIQNERGLYFNIRELPFSAAEDMEQLCRSISDFDVSDYQIRIRDFLNSVGSYEKGTAAKAVAEYIISKIKH